MAQQAFIKGYFYPAEEKPSSLNELMDIIAYADPHESPFNWARIPLAVNKSSGVVIFML
jgi:hypothetical protein